MFTYEYHVKGITCTACIKLIERALKKNDSITAITVRLDGKMTLTSSREITKEEVEKFLPDTSYSILS